MRRLCAALAAAAVLAGCGGSDRTRSLQPPPPKRVVTIVQDDAELLHRSPEQIASDLDDLRALGVDWVRITAGWSVIAPERPDFDATDPDAYPPGTWNALDQAISMAAQRGLRVAIDIAFLVPDWAVRPRGLDVAAYADFAEAVARRYPGSVAFTIWNEPNLATFLRPQWKPDGNGGWEPLSPITYRAMVRAAVPRIEAAAPLALVLIGNTSSLGQDTGNGPDDRMSPLRFLRSMACVDARLRPLDTPDCRGFEPLPGDGWAHHPYSEEVKPWEHDPQPGTVRMGDLDRLSTMLARLHAQGRTVSDLPLYLTEYGYQTNPPDPTRSTTLAEQARWLSEGERIARANPAVRSVAQFLVRDLPEKPGADLRTRWRDFQSGLRFQDGTAKPAHDAYALPLVARDAGPGRVAFWGLVRPGLGARPVTIEQLGPDGAWRRLTQTRTQADGTFTVTVDADPGATFRLASGTFRGATLKGIR